MAEYIDTSINPADYIEVWEAEDAEHGKQLVMAVDDLKCLPPADVRPVRRGEWKSENTDALTLLDVRTCSVCGLKKVFITNFCPSCGADMRGGDAD